MKQLSTAEQILVDLTFEKRNIKQAQITDWNNKVTARKLAKKKAHNEKPRN